MITTPTGNIGSKVARRLLDDGQRITVVARDAAKVADLAARGATVVVGSHGDAALLTEATRGAHALFVVTPPDFATTDIRAHYRPFGEAAAAAIEANHIGHVVHLSSVGADLPSGNGPVAGLYVNEQILDATDAADTALVHLRPSYFMENTLGQIGAIAQAGALFTTFAPGTQFPMIATADIAERAARLLVARDWTGRKVVELQGPEEFSYEQVAAVLSEVLGRPLKHITVSPEQQRESLKAMGASRVLADSFHELTVGIMTGKVRFHEPRSASNTTPTTYPQFAQTVFKHVFAAASSVA